MSLITSVPTVVTPAIEVGQLWRDEVLEITYRVLSKGTDGWLVRCISDESGKVWEDEMPFECFATELVRG